MLRTVGCLVLLLLPAGLRAVDGPVDLPVSRFATLPDDVRHPEGLVADPAGEHVFVATFDAREPADARRNVLLRYGADGRLQARRDFGTTPLTGLAWHRGQVYVLNFGASKLQRLPADFDATTPVEDVATFATLEPAAPSPRDVANPDGSHDRITFGAAGFPAPNGMVFDRDGHLYVSDSFQGAVLRIDAAARCRPCTPRVISRDPLLATANATLPFGANGLAFGDDPRWLFVANAGDGRLLKLARDGGPVQVVAESLPGADGLLFHDGLFWVAANQADLLLGLDATGRIRARAGGFAGLDADGAPRGLLFPAGGAVLGRWMIVANLALPLTPATGDEWEEDVRRWTLARFPLPD